MLSMLTELVVSLSHLMEAKPGRWQLQSQLKSMEQDLTWTPLILSTRPRSIVTFMLVVLHDPATFPTPSPRCTRLIQKVHFTLVLLILVVQSEIALCTCFINRLRSSRSTWRQRQRRIGITQGGFQRSLSLFQGQEPRKKMMVPGLFLDSFMHVLELHEYLMICFVFGERNRSVLGTDYWLHHNRWMQESSSPLWVTTAVAASF